MSNIHIAKQLSEWELAQEAKRQHAEDVRDEDVIAYITVKVARSGAMAVGGHITDEMFAIACLEQAKQSVKDFHKRMKGDSAVMSPQIIPAYDNPLAA